MVRLEGGLTGDSGNNPPDTARRVLVQTIHDDWYIASWSIQGVAMWWTERDLPLSKSTVAYWYDLPNNHTHPKRELLS